MHGLKLAIGAGLAAAGLGGCATPAKSAPATESAAPAPADTAKPPAFASTYAPRPSAPVLIRGAHVIDGVGGERATADVLLENAKIAAIGANLPAPPGATVVDGAGKFVTPGIIDAHSHLGVYPSPGYQGLSDGNESTQPNTAEVWAEHSVWPMDPGFSRAIAGGVTTMHILPGSANLFGGRGVTVHPIPGALSVMQMKVPDAPQSLKMACGENPSRVYGGRNSSPATGMGNVAGYRAAYAKASEYNRKWTEYETKLASWERNKDKPNKDGKKPERPSPPDRDLELDTLRGVLKGEILVQWHCYRADEMLLALDVAKEFNFKVTTFHHAVEAYKIGDVLARENVCAAMWADWWGFKLEAYDGVRENIPFVHARGGCSVVHSDDAVGIQRLNQEAAKALSDGRRAGVDITRADAWRWLTSNPAKAVGIFDRTGSLEPGKAADVVVWSADPFSSYAVAEKVFIDGALTYERAVPADPPSDFELGHPSLTRRAQ